jgi:hypothetical protein
MLGQRLWNTICLPCHVLSLLDAAQVRVNVELPEGAEPSAVFLSLSGGKGFKNNARQVGPLVDPSNIGLPCCQHTSTVCFSSVDFFLHSLPN